jgi:hypothetical protein
MLTLSNREHDRGDDEIAINEENIVRKTSESV